VTLVTSGNAIDHYPARADDEKHETITSAKQASRCTPDFGCTSSSQDDQSERSRLRREF